MSVFSLLYVSRSLVHGQAAEIAVADIVSVARQRNLDLGVCGALLFTGTQFSQVLEGSRAGVEELMDSINRDPRHTDIVVIRQGDVPQARFARWTLAYCGPSAFVAQAVEAALDEASQGARARGEGLLRLLEEFSSESQDNPPR